MVKLIRLFAWILFLAAAASRGAEHSVEQLDFFEKKIRPILAEKCYECHSAKSQKLKAHLQLDHRAHLLTGGDTGPSIVPGKPDASLLIQTISYENPDLQMPPKGALSPEIVANFKQWIADGAAWPDEPVPAHGAEGKVERFDLKKRFEDHWSWREVKKPSPPSVQNALRVNSPIDQFILSKVEAAGLKPADPADKRTLVRRIYFDVIGLPPSPAQIAAFLEDESPQAYEKVVDELLASPHFGEKWARHWMDLVRYAETYGHEFDYPLDFAHEYRDYLIRAYNSDLPYDQFVTEHIAGDLIKKPRLHPKDRYNESILGTAFWYFHEATHAPTDVLQDEADRMDNQIDVFGKSFLGLTVACARCHDHKFDAISTADYYALTTYLHSSARQEYPMDFGQTREKAVAQLNELRKKGAETLKAIPVDQTAAFLPGRYLIAAADLIKNENKQPPSGDPWSGEVYDDFETGRFEKWKATGAAFGEGPLKGVANSKLPDEKAHGTLISTAFQINKPYLNFMIGGGSQKTTSFEIRIDGKSIYQASGKNSENLEAMAWNLSPYIGKQGELRIVDEEKGKFGYIMVDRIVQSDAPAAPLTSPRFPREQAILDYAKTKNLDPDTLKSWSMLFMFDDKDDKRPAGYFGKLLRNPDLSRGLADFQKKIVTQTADYQKKATLLASFKSDPPTGWSTSGFALHAPEPTIGIGFEPDTPFSTPGVYSSSHLGKLQNGILRSPTFEIPEGEIHVKARSENLFARVVMDNYHMAKFQPLLFGGTIESKLSSDGESRWFSFRSNLNKYVGHKAFLEFVDKGGATFEIEEIWMGTGGTPPVGLHPVVEVAVGSGAATLEEVATNLDTAWTMGWETIRQGRAAPSTPPSLHSSIPTLLNWMSRNKLFTIDKLSPELAAILGEGHRIDRTLPAERYAVAMAEGTPESGNVYIRGSHRSLGEPVSRRMITALGGREGDRLVLAGEVVKPGNPLTSRVMVNRIWHHLFGRGIVPTVDDFGPMGQPASHPELLDWLATDFVEHGWSVKHVIRQILLSNTYRQSSLAQPEIDMEYLATTDPENLLLHRMPVRRLQAEAIRDAILTVSGRLDPKFFGPSIPTHRTQFMSGRGARGSGPLDGDGRRSLYGAVYRNFLSPMMLTFDQPGPFGPKGRRSVSNVPAQALALMNDPFVIEQTKVWAQKSATKTFPSEEQRIEEMHETALGTKPTIERKEALKAFLEQQSRQYGKASENVWADLGHVLINLKDFVYLN